MNKKMIVLSVALLISTAIVAMDKPEIIIKSTRVQLLELVDKYLDHKSICALGLVNKSCDEYMKNTRSNRGQRLGSCAGALSSVIHKYGSTRCFVYISQHPERGLRLMMHNQLNDRSKSKIFEDFISPLPHNPVPFLNAKKEWCFDCYAKEGISIGCLVGNRLPYEVIRYNMSGMTLPIIVKILNASGRSFLHCKAINFRNYPSLLQSILSVKKVKETFSIVQDKGFFLLIDNLLRKEYFLEIDFGDVVLKDDWKNEKIFAQESDFFALKEHPSLKKIVEKYYEKQAERQIHAWYDLCHDGEQSYVDVRI